MNETLYFSTEDAANMNFFSLDEVDGDFASVVKRSIDEAGLALSNKDRLIFMPSPTKVQDRLPRYGKNCIGLI